jgi:hypothetical protein
VVEVERHTRLIQALAALVVAVMVANQLQRELQIQAVAAVADTIRA